MMSSYCAECGKDEGGAVSLKQDVQVMYDCQVLQRQLSKESLVDS